MTNIRRDQGLKGYCSAYGIANIAEKQLGHFISDKAITSYYKEHDQGPEGIRALDLIQLMKTHPLDGITIDHHELVYHMYSKENPAAKLRQVIQDPDLEVAIGIWTREDGIKLSHNHYLLTEGGPKTGSHFVAVDDFARKEVHRNRHIITGVRCENSWGNDWGDDGFFNIDFDEIWSEIHTIHAIKLKFA